MTPIRSIEELYAHALAMEREAADRYSEFERWFRDRDEPILAGLCRTLAGAEHEHLAQLEKASRELEIPELDPSDYRWIDAGTPESGARELFYRAARPEHLLQVALQAETRASLFYEWAARTAVDPAARTLAGAMAGEEHEHVAWVRSALEYHPSRHAPWEKLFD